VPIQLEGDLKAQHLTFPAAKKMEEDYVLALPHGVAVKEIELCRGGQSHEEVVTALYEQLRPALVRYAYHLAASTRDAEDLVQIAFLQLFDHLNRGSEIKNLRGWIYRAVHSLVTNHVTRLERRQSLISDWFSDVPLTDEETVEVQMSRRQEIEKALLILGDMERESLMLRAEGLSYQEIGDVLEISAKSVSVYLARGLKKFSKYHEDENLK
jgi:RNA polymerase sigma-70 factor (ECF subfamily)